MMLQEAEKRFTGTREIAMLKSFLILTVLSFLTLPAFAESKVTTEVLKADLNADEIVKEISFIKKPVEKLDSLANSKGTARRPAHL